MGSGGYEALLEGVELVDIETFLMREFVVTACGLLALR